MASLAAFYIRGKHLPTYTPSMDMGAYGGCCCVVRLTGAGDKQIESTGSSQPLQRRRRRSGCAEESAGSAARALRPAAVPPPPGQPSPSMARACCR